jgi:hypothetical protein
MQLYIKKYKESEKYNSDLRYRSNADHFERIRERFLDGLNEWKPMKTHLKLLL